MAKVCVKVRLSDVEAHALDSMIGTGVSRAEFIRQLVAAEYRRRQEARRAAAKPAEPVHTADGIIIDGVLFTPDERLTSLDDLVCRK